MSSVSPRPVQSHASHHIDNTITIATSTVTGLLLLILSVLIFMALYIAVSMRRKKNRGIL